MTTRAKIEKRIYDDLLKTEKRVVIQHQYLPENLGVKNLSTYLKGATAEEAKDRMFVAFHEAFHHAAQKDWDISSVRLTNASAWNLTKGALVFEADSVENDQEFEYRIREMAQTQAYKEWAPIYEERRAKQALKNAQADLDAAQDKVNKLSK